MTNWFRHGWQLKIISLGLALGLWYYAVNEESVEITRTIPLEVTIENKNMSIREVSAKTLRMTVKAPRAILAEAAGANIVAKHNFGRELKQAGEYSFQPTAREINLSSIGMHVIKLEPSVVKVVVDELVTQSLPTKAKFQGETAFGYQVREADVQLDPNAVLVQGPQGEVEKMGIVYTRPINLTGRTRSFRMSSELVTPASVKVLSINSVDVSVPIHEVSDEKQLDDIVVKMIRPSGALGIAELNPQKISVIIQGPRRVLQNLTADKMHAYADLSGLDYGDHQVDVSWVFPPGVSIKDDKRMQVTAQIRRER